MFTSQPAFGLLPPDTQFVVAVATGLFFGNRRYDLGERIPREECPVFTLHSLYNLRRIAIESERRSESELRPVKQEQPIAPPLPLGAAINASRQGPIRPPRR